MWFKNLILYRFTRPFELDADALEAKLAEGRFRPCGKTEASTYGWVAPLPSQSDALCFAQNGQLLLAACKEERILPASVVREQLDAKVSAIESEQGRPVYKKERDSIKEELLLDLLPKAFTRQSKTFAYIAPAQGWMLVDAGSFKKAEALTSRLRSNLGSLPLIAPLLNNAPGAMMTDWLTNPHGLDQDFALGDECELRDPGEEGGIIRCKREQLTASEITQHLDCGKQVSKLALSFREQVGFVLQEDLSLKRLKFTDELKEESETLAGDDAEAGQQVADLIIMTQTLNALIPALLEALGGEDQSQYS